jgi:DNA-directed RNA polymerase I, II, and III subunit RPABC2
MSDLEEVSVEDIETSEDDEVKGENVNEYESEEETEVNDDEEDDEEDEGVEETKEENDEQSEEEIIDNDDEEILIKPETKQAAKSNKKTPAPKQIQQPINIDANDSDTSDDETDDDEDYLKKFDKEIRKNYLIDFHPEALINNYSEIQSLTQIIRDNRTGIIVDDLHKTIPFLTKYEKTRILGQRAKQINSGAKPYINIDNDEQQPIIDGYLIAQKELELKRLPFIIRRPLPNGGSEYWKLSDLQLID